MALKALMAEELFKIYQALKKYAKSIGIEDQLSSNLNE